MGIGFFTARDAQQVNIAAIARQLRQGLEGMSYIGMIDTGLYANISPGTNFSERTGVHWHLHLFAWGKTQKEMKVHFTKLNDCADNYRPIIPRPQGLGPDWSQVSGGSTAGRYWRPS